MRIKARGRVARVLIVKLHIIGTHQSAPVWCAILYVVSAFKRVKSIHVVERELDGVKLRVPKHRVSSYE